jgi:hypothetical protein
MGCDDDCGTSQPEFDNSNFPGQHRRDLAVAQHQHGRGGTALLKITTARKSAGEIDG